MGGGDGCRYAGVDVSWDLAMSAQRSSRRLFPVIFVGLVLPDCLKYCIFCFDYCILCFAKIKINYLSICIQNLP